MFLNEVYIFRKPEFIFSKIQKKTVILGNIFTIKKKNGFEF